MTRRLERLLCDRLKAVLDGKPVTTPEAGAGLVEVFGQLSGARSWNAHGPNPISFADIEAYCRLMRLPLRPEHISIIQSMDHVWTSDFYARRNQTAGKDTTSKVSATPLSAGLFDAMSGG